VRDKHIAQQDEQGDHREPDHAEQRHFDGVEVPFALALGFLALFLVEVESMIGGHGVHSGYYPSSPYRGGGWHATCSTTIRETSTRCCLDAHRAGRGARHPPRPVRRRRP